MTGLRLPAVVVGVTATLVVPAPARAAGTAGACPDAAGVTVVVDFNELGGGTVVRCAPGTQANGLAALRNAGFQVAGTLRWGEGFVCRIEGKPSVATEKCVDTPPANAYWSYWHADNGGRWRYSDRGVLTRKPPAGSFEGWSFSLDRSPDDPPSPRVAPVRPPSSPPPSSDGGNPPVTVGPSRTGPPMPPGVSTTPPVTTGPTVPPGSVPPASVPVERPGIPQAGSPTPAPPTGPASGAASTDVAAQPEDGFPTGTVTGVMLLVALAGGGILAARRRRAVYPHD